MSRPEMEALGWEELDVLLVTGDAYVDHPSFGAALLFRWLTLHGYRTGVVSQPRPDVPEDVAVMGRPRLFAGVTAGALDSMLAHYTAFRKKRREDAYTPGGLAGRRPNRACVVYSNLVKRAFPGLPVVLGGVEASLRRISHYDFWSDSLRRSILLDAKATAILYGMAEHSILELADRLRALAEPDAEAVRRAALDVPGSVTAMRPNEVPRGLPRVDLPSHEDIPREPGLLLTAVKLLERQVLQNRNWAVQACGDRVLVLSPPGEGLSGADLDTLYGLPFTRKTHPAHDKPVPAAGMIRWSLTAHRGCAGGCSFCALALHQGRRIRSRSRGSILEEVRRMAADPDFSGTVSDLGGPSANMWGGRCRGDAGACKRESCLVPRICPKFHADQADFVTLLRDARDVGGVKSVRTASGWRMDLALTDPSALGAMIRDFVGGQVKVAPEHLAPHVLALMRKPKFPVFEAFLEVFARESERAGKEQYVIPYLMSAFPGCRDEDMRDLAAWLAERGWRPRQVQCFIPLPGTAASAMFYAGIGPDGTPLHVARTDAQRRAQHELLIQADAEGGREAGGSGARSGTAAPATKGKGSKTSARPGRSRPKPSGATSRTGSTANAVETGRPGAPWRKGSDSAPGRSKGKSGARKPAGKRRG